MAKQQKTAPAASVEDGRIRCALRIGEWNLIRLARLVGHGVLYQIYIDSDGPAFLTPAPEPSVGRLPIVQKIDLSASDYISHCIATLNPPVYRGSDSVESLLSPREYALVLILRTIAPAVVTQASVRDREIHYIEHRYDLAFNAMGRVDLRTETLESLFRRIPDVF